MRIAPLASVGREQCNRWVIIVIIKKWYERVSVGLKYLRWSSWVLSTLGVLTLLGSLSPFERSLRYGIADSADYDQLFSVLQKTTILWTWRFSQYFAANGSNSCDYNYNFWENYYKWHSIVIFHVDNLQLRPKPVIHILTAHFRRY